MMSDMRTTVDIPSMLHERIKAYAQMQGQSFAATATDAMMRGMATIDTPSSARVNPKTGLMVFNFGRGRAITSAEVADLIDEDN